jgi:phosphate:Na+ symporter
MAAEGLLSLPAGIALALGANIGTCMTAVLAAIGKPVAARRAAAAHVLFNVIGVLIWIPFIGLLAGIVVDISPSAPNLEGTARMAAEVPRQIANAHTTFNVINTILFIGFAGWFARAVERLVPDKPEVIKEIIRPKFIDEALLETPSLAMNAARMEIQHLGEIATAMVHQVGPAIRNRSREEIGAVETLGDQVRVLHESIMEYLGEIRRHEFTEEERDLFMRLMRGADEVERISDVVESDIIPIGQMLIDRQIATSETTRHTLDALYARVCDAVEVAIAAIAELDEGRANTVINMKAEINGLIDEALRFQAQRVTPSDPGLIEIFRLEDEVIDALKRIYSLSKRIAKLLLPVAVALKAA